MDAFPGYRRASLAQVFADVVAELPPTDSFVLGVSRLKEYGGQCLSVGELLRRYA